MFDKCNGYMDMEVCDIEEPFSLYRSKTFDKLQDMETCKSEIDNSLWVEFDRKVRQSASSSFRGTLEVILEEETLEDEPFVISSSSDDVIYPSSPIHKLSNSDYFYHSDWERSESNDDLVHHDFFSTEDSLNSLNESDTSYDRRYTKKWIEDKINSCSLDDNSQYKKKFPCSMMRNEFPIYNYLKSSKVKRKNKSALTEDNCCDKKMSYSDSHLDNKKTPKSCDMYDEVEKYSSSLMNEFVSDQLCLEDYEYTDDSGINIIYAPDDKSSSSENSLTDGNHVYKYNHMNNNNMDNDLIEITDDRDNLIVKNSMQCLEQTPFSKSEPENSYCQKDKYRYDTEHNESNILEASSVAESSHERLADQLVSKKHHSPELKQPNFCNKLFKNIKNSPKKLNKSRKSDDKNFNSDVKCFSCSNMCCNFLNYGPHRNCKKFQEDITYTDLNQSEQSTEKTIQTQPSTSRLSVNNAEEHLLQKKTDYEEEYVIIENIAENGNFDSMESLNMTKNETPILLTETSKFSHFLWGDSEAHIIARLVFDAFHHKVTKPKVVERLFPSRYHAVSKFYYDDDDSRLKANDSTLPNGSEIAIYSSNIPVVQQKQSNHVISNFVDAFSNYLSMIGK